MKKSQNYRIYNWLDKGNSITPLGALNKFNCFRLSARINDLRKYYYIKTKLVTKKGKTFASYSF